MTQGTSLTTPEAIHFARHMTLETGLHLQACSGLIAGRGRKISVIVRNELIANGWEGSLPRKLDDLLEVYQQVLLDTYEILAPVQRMKCKHLKLIVT